MEITASLVKKLRDSSGVGMMDAKKALVENNGDMEASIDWLRKKGISKAEKKSGRTAAEGLVSYKKVSEIAVLVEINSETDFVAKNTDFQKMADSITTNAINCKNINDLLESNIDGKNVNDFVSDHIAKIGENINVRRFNLIRGKNIVSYIHNAVNHSMGKIGVILSYEGGNEETAKKIAMHIAAAKPLSLSENDLDNEVIEREKSIFFEQAKQSGKPENVIENIVSGKIKKFFQEVVLLKQKFVMDPDNSVEEILSNSSMKINEFVRLEVGEGIDKEIENFADEVKKTVKG